MELPSQLQECNNEVPVMPTSIKGAPLLNCMAVVREVAGVKRYDELLSGCPIETQHLLRRTLMAIEWVSLDAWSPFLQAIFERLANRDENQFKRLLRVICQRDFQTIYRPYVLNAKPTTVLGKMQSIWSAYFDSGSLSAGPLTVSGSQHELTIQMRDLETSSSVMFMVVHAYLEQVLAMVGAKDFQVVRNKEARSGMGRLSCEFHVRFREDT